MASLASGIILTIFGITCIAVGIRLPFNHTVAMIQLERFLVKYRKKLVKNMDPGSNKQFNYYEINLNIYFFHFFNEYKTTNFHGFRPDMFASLGISH